MVITTWLIAAHEDVSLAIRVDFKRCKHFASGGLDQLRVPTRIREARIGETQTPQRRPNINHLLARESSNPRGPEFIVRNAVGLAVQRSIREKYEPRGTLFDLRAIFHPASGRDIDFDPEIRRNRADGVGCCG